MLSSWNKVVIIIVVIILFRIKDVKIDKNVHLIYQ